MLVVLAAPLTAVERDEERAAALNGEGVRLYQEGEYARALERFRTALELHPGATEIRINLGKTHTAVAIQLLAAGHRAGAGRDLYQRALENIKLALLYWEGDLDTHHTLGFCHLKLGEAAAAATALERAVTIDDRAFRSWRLLAVAREQAGDLPAAIEACEHAVVLRPEDTAVAARLRRLRLDRQALAEYRVEKSERFRVHHPPEISVEQVAAIVKILESFTAELERRWALRRGGTTIVICYPPGQFSARTGLHEEVGGAFDGKIRVAFPAELEGGGLRLEQVLRHEAVHMLLRRLGESPPRWVDEGLAQLLDGDPRADWDSRWRRVVNEQPRVSLEARMAQFDPERPCSWSGLYLHSFYFFRYLERLGQSFRLDMLVREVGRGKSWNEAFQSVYSSTPQELDRQFRRSFSGSSGKAKQGGDGAEPGDGDGH